MNMEIDKSTEMFLKLKNARNELYKVKETYENDQRNIFKSLEVLKWGILLNKEICEDMPWDIIKGQFYISECDSTGRYYHQDNDLKFWIRIGHHPETGEPTMEYGEGEIEKPHFIHTTDWETYVALYTRKRPASTDFVLANLWIKGNKFPADYWGQTCWKVAPFIAKLFKQDFKGIRKDYWDEHFLSHLEFRGIMEKGYFDLTDDNESKD